MCLPNIFSQSPRKSPSPCEASRRARVICLHLPSLPLRPLPALLRFPPLPARKPSRLVPRRLRSRLPRARPLQALRNLLLLLLLALPPSLNSFDAFAQVERQELPAIPGTESEAPSAPSRPQVLSPGAATGTSAQESPLPSDLWSGTDAPALERLLGGVKLPSASPALATLIARALAQGASNGTELAIRLNALSKAGRIDEEIALLGGAMQAGEPGAAALYATALLEAGREEEACAIAIDPPPQSVPATAKPTRAAFLMPAYCAAAKGDQPGANLALQLARDRGVQAPVPFAVIERLGKTSSKPIVLPDAVETFDYVFLKLDPKSLPSSLAAKASPALLFLIAHDDNAPPGLRLAAAERAASLNVIDGAALAKAYRDVAAKITKAGTPQELRAKLFAALEAAPSAKLKAESIDALLASGRDAGIEFAVAEALDEPARGLMQDPEATPFAGTLLRVAALAGDNPTAWGFFDQGAEKLRVWQLLLAAADPSDPRTETALSEGVELAAVGGLPAPFLHRLLAVLDALDCDVPIPLWDAASKMPQPNDGYLPETGVLSQLKAASDHGDVGRTVLLVAASLGPKGPADANLLALGDAVRALKRVGLEAEARRVGFESLYARVPAKKKA